MNLWLQIASPLIDESHTRIYYWSRMQNNGIPHFFIGHVCSTYSTMKWPNDTMLLHRFGSNSTNFLSNSSMSGRLAHLLRFNDCFSFFFVPKLYKQWQLRIWTCQNRSSLYFDTSANFVQIREMCLQLPIEKMLIQHIKSYLLTLRMMEMTTVAAVADRQWLVYRCRSCDVIRYFLFTAITSPIPSIMLICIILIKAKPEWNFHSKSKLIRWLHPPCETLIASYARIYNYIWTICDRQLAIYQFSFFLTESARKPKHFTCPARETEIMKYNNCEKFNRKSDRSGFDWILLLFTRFRI